MDTKKLEAGPTQRVDLGLPSTGAASAEVGADGTLYVGRGARVVAIDPQTFTALRRWSVRAPLTGFAFSPDGRRLYAAEGNQIELLDPASGRSIGVEPAPDVRGIVSVQARA
jgi:DNA-binding beta-propeller fold protein YncE